MSFKSLLATVGGAGMSQGFGMIKDPLEETKRLMGALVRQPPKPHEKMKIGKRTSGADERSRRLICGPPRLFKTLPAGRSMRIAELFYCAENDCNRYRVPVLAVQLLRPGCAARAAPLRLYVVLLEHSP